jgi:hypothetical protein
MERVEDPFGEQLPWFNRNCYRVGQDLVCMLSEKFPEKAGSKPEEQSLLEASFSKRKGWPYII